MENDFNNLKKYMEENKEAVLKVSKDTFAGMKYTELWNGRNYTCSFLDLKTIKELEKEFESRIIWEN